MYLSIELQSFAVYVLATLYKNSNSSTNAGLKYFLLGGLSSCFILFGSGLIYAFTGLTNLESIYSLLSVSETNEIISNNFSTSFLYTIPNNVGGVLNMDKSGIMGGIFLGIIFIVVGFFFKIASAPLHNWSPDVYDDTPTIVTI
jgi:NADH-ubiquinone oxidoreductase chain 2